MNGIWFSFRIRILAAASTFLAAGCSKKQLTPDEASQGTVYSDPQLQKGRYHFGFETTAFYLCGSKEGWDIDTSDVNGFRHFLNSVSTGKKLEADYYVEWIGAVSNRGLYGHMGVLPRSIKLKELKFIKVYEGECK
jgi:hypothetical protein